MKKFEYKKINLGNISGTAIIKEPNKEYLLTIEGEQGWELISTYQVNNTLYGFLKREKQ